MGLALHCTRYKWFMRLSYAIMLVIELVSLALWREITYWSNVLFSKLFFSHEELLCFVWIRNWNIDLHSLRWGKVIFSAKLFTVSMGLFKSALVLLLAGGWIFVFKLSYRKYETRPFWLTIPGTWNVYTFIEFLWIKHFNKELNYVISISVR